MAVTGRRAYISYMSGTWRKAAWGWRGSCLKAPMSQGLSFVPSGFHCHGPKMALCLQASCPSSRSPRLFWSLRKEASRRISGSPYRPYRVPGLPLLRGRLGLTGLLAGPYLGGLQDAGAQNHRRGRCGWRVGSVLHLPTSPGNAAGTYIRP